MKVIVTTPTVDGNIRFETASSLAYAGMAMNKAGIEWNWLIEAGCPFVGGVRNKLLERFMTETDGDVCIMLDADVSFPVETFVELLAADKDMVGGLYPKKTVEEDYPVMIYTDANGYPLMDGKLIKASGLPTGFLKVTRKAVERMFDLFPQTHEFGGMQCHNLFGHGVEEGRFWGEDFMFCKRWEAMEGEMFVIPYITFGHTGAKTWTGNYHEYLTRQPGGVNHVC